MANEVKTAQGLELPRVLAVGFSGHRKLADEGLCRRAVLGYLSELKASTKLVVYGVSSVAAGADLLFAESCLELGIPHRVLLPMAQEAFREDFDEAGWARAETVMARAISVEVIGGGDAREERYYECGLETVQQSELLVAIWDGEGARGLGGTQQIVEFAGQMGRGMVWIHSVTGERTMLHEWDIVRNERDAELDFLNERPAEGADESAGNPAQVWLKKLDENAMVVSPGVKRRAALPIVLTAAAAFAGVGNIHTNHGYKTFWSVAAVVFGLLAAALPAMMKLAQKQAAWVRIRTAAEVTRSFVALWDLPGRYKIVGPGILPELSGMLLGLGLLKSTSVRTKAKTLEEFKDEYLKERLLGQKKYFVCQSKAADEKGSRYRMVAKICGAFAIAISATTFVMGIVPRFASHTMGERDWFSLGSSLLFQVATIAGAMVIVHDCDRRHRRYTELHHALGVWEKELRALHTWHSVAQIVERVERALLIEVLEWRALLQNKKI
jgi:hypothetical protein